MAPSRKISVFLGSTLLLPLVCGGVLLWKERAWRDTLPVLANLAIKPSPSVDAQAPFNPGAIASLLGLVAQESLARSSEALVLKASFVSSTGDSRALLAGTEGERTYRLGDTLPGGSVLRRIEVGQVVFWRNGREEVLPIEMSAKRWLLPIEGSSPGVAGASANLYLQPTPYSGQSD
ncbi:type II secretion system (T2SS) protein C [Pseudomonas baetica]|uniref:Type II secretion system (T2SS) protein C n=1 Tax=Pseudomonas baetica TaxID=674054 RepID=A0ABX4PZ47_9PSED|nr:type II secretion system protein N [Pseudomonas baetica]PKA69801.1 type II secretion system (T2SS) protein C [Pseudomonas baetica]PTC21438.1 protein XcpP [Pseudomonas baetica]